VRSSSALPITPSAAFRSCCPGTSARSKQPHPNSHQNSSPKCPSIFKWTLTHTHLNLPPRSQPDGYNAVVQGRSGSTGVLGRLERPLPRKKYVLEICVSIPDASNQACWGMGATLFHQSHTRRYDGHSDFFQLPATFVAKRCTRGAN